ncbi:MAG: VOC family protein [Microbacterium sp.]
MTGLTPYLSFDGSAREALTAYRDVFGGDLALHTYAEFGRTDGPADAIAHGILDGPVALFAADAPAGEPALGIEGVLFSLLGTDEPAQLERWFAALADGGTVVDALQERPWGAHDGTVRDRFGVTWLIGYEV